MVFEGRLRDIQRLQAQGMTSEAIKECAMIIEQVLEKFYKDIWAFLNSDEKQKLVNIERKFSRKKTPVDTLGLRRWINFYEESKLPKLLLKCQAINTSAFDFKTLSKINVIRNKCTHENYRASQRELLETYGYTIKLLKSAGLIKEEPVGIRHVPREESISESRVWGDKIRLLLASEPSLEIEEIFEADFGKFYEVIGKWEFVGAVTDEDLVRILLLETEAGYHEDIAEEVSDKVVKLVEERIKKKLPRLHGIKIEVSITDSVGDWGNYSIEVQL